MGLIDSHAHLTFEGLSRRIDDVLARCDEAGVEKVISIGTDLEHARAAIDLARRHPDRIAAAAAFHPHEAVRVNDADLAAMSRLWTDPGVVALGEMGLDYHYDFAERTVQRSVFEGQLELASRCDKTIIIHCREALDDVESILVDQGYETRRVVFHCFTGTADEAARVAERGWRISFTGVVTFKKSTTLQKIARDYPGDALMIETDSPYLSPVPVRGVQPNEPAHLSHIARFLAKLREVAYEQIVDQTATNTRAFFRL